MKTFSRLSLFVPLCLALVLMLVGNTADVHAQGETTLSVKATTGENEFVTIGTDVFATFTAFDKDSQAVGGAMFRITHEGLINVSHRNNLVVATPTTGISKGELTVTGTTAEPEAWIKVEWVGVEKHATAFFNAQPEHSSVLIVVNKPTPNEELSVGSTFTQEITIENKSNQWPTYPLTAWQMDIVFNPNILEVTNVTEGDLLGDSENTENDTLFLPQINTLEDPEAVDAASVAELTRINLKGRISASQALLDTETGVVLNKEQSKTLLTIEFKVLEYAEEALGIHNVLILTNSDTNKDNRTPDRISYAILVKDVFVATVHYSYDRYDVNQDGMINILDIVLAASSIGTHNLRADVDDNGIVNVLDLVQIAKRLGQSPGKTKTNESSVNDPPNLGLAPLASRNIDPATIQSWIDSARIEDNGSEMFKRGITNLEALLNSKVPTKTKLLLNYPNPFNPETWVPYQLAESADVTVTIYSMNGNLIRTLKLGHQSAGTYINRSQAAYWDGRNELGEHSASGVYFYTFTAGKFSATGKMLIRK